MKALRWHASELWIKPVVLVGLVIVAYLAAINRAQNLPWVIAALLAATTITGVAWPYWLVKRLRVSRVGPTRAEEGEVIHFEVEVHNRGFLPRFMIEVTDRLPFARQQDRLKTQALGIATFVPGRGQRRFLMPMLCEKRGFYQLGPVGLRSSFPLGLLEVNVQGNGGVQTLTVYPDVFPIVSLPLRGAPSQIHRGGYLLPKGNGAAEFSGLREYCRGDNPRHIHWPTTARLNELMVKEFEPLASACVTIALDLAAASNVGEGKQATLEYAARIAASIARFTCSNNIRTCLSAVGEHEVEVSVGSGEYQHQRILDTLAVIEANGDTPYAQLLQGLAAHCSNGETLVVFLSESAAWTEDTLQALAMLHANGVYLMAVIFARNGFIDAAESDDGLGEHVLATLLELDAHCITVNCGDDLLSLFNT